MRIVANNNIAADVYKMISCKRETDAFNTAK